MFCVPKGLTCGSKYYWPAVRVSSSWVKTQILGSIGVIESRWLQEMWGIWSFLLSHRWGGQKWGCSQSHPALPQPPTTVNQPCHPNRYCWDLSGAGWYWGGGVEEPSDPWPSVLCLTIWSQISPHMPQVFVFFFPLSCMNPCSSWVSWKCERGAKKIRPDIFPPVNLFRDEFEQLYLLPRGKWQHHSVLKQHSHFHFLLLMRLKLVDIGH